VRVTLVSLGWCYKLGECAKLCARRSLRSCNQSSGGAAYVLAGVTWLRQEDVKGMWYALGCHAKWLGLCGCSPSVPVPSLSVPSRRSTGNHLTLLGEDIQENFMIDDSCVEVLQKKQARFLFATPTMMIYFGPIWLCKKACWRVLAMLKKVIRPAEFLHVLRHSSIILLFLAILLSCSVV